MSAGRILLLFFIAYIITLIVLITFEVQNILNHREVKQVSPVLCKPNVTRHGIGNQREVPPPIYQQPVQFGPGNFGKPVEFHKGLFTENDTRLISQYYRTYDYNAFISDLLPFPRLLPDYRPDECRKLKYPDNLPRVSVIIPFRNERLSTLLRTIHGVLFYTPEHLLEEIIIIDDASTEVELTYKLDLHVQHLAKVSIIRKKTNVGLMMARQAGIDASKTEYFICMDSHMEVSIGWVEPILNRLLENPKALVYSSIGGVDNSHFAVHHNVNGFGKPYDFPFFGWNFEQQQSRHSEEYKNARRNKTDPILMGNAMGMMICMKKSWFLQLGGFDPGMQVWGAEQIEMSVKTWMCGGSVEMMPCSFVAHIFRRIVWNLQHVGQSNKVRLIETWVDEPYKDIIYKYNGIRPEDINYGDVSERVNVRNQNQCHTFQYFLDKVREFGNIHLPTESRKLGEVRNSQSNMCLDRNYGGDYPLHYPCNGGVRTQLFEWSKSGELRNLGQCVYVDEKTGNVKFKHCDHFISKDLKTWQYDEKELTFVHIITGKCLTADLNSRDTFATECTSIDAQKWTWNTL